MKFFLIKEKTAYVIDGKLSGAIRQWKTELSNSGNIQRLKEINDGFIKPSRKRKAILELAKYKETFRQ